AADVGSRAGDESRPHRGRTRGRAPDGKGSDAGRVDGSAGGPSMLTRLSPGLRRRIVMLLAGNAVLLMLIYASVADQASASDAATSWSRFARVLTSAGPDVAPLALAALGLTGIICAGAIDLSIGAIIP